VRSLAFVLCAIVAFLVPILFTARNVSTWPARLSYAGEESYEGVALAEMTRLGRGEPIYAAGVANGFSDASYGPLYYLLGKHIIDLQNPFYFPLRLVSLVGMFGCAAGCGLLSYSLSESRLAFFLAPLVFLAYGMVTDRGLQALSDGVALSVFFIGFLVAYQFQGSRSSGSTTSCST
jgi:hypothetical protein